MDSLLRRCQCGDLCQCTEWIRSCPSRRWYGGRWPSAMDVRSYSLPVARTECSRVSNCSNRFATIGSFVKQAWFSFWTRKISSLKSFVSLRSKSAFLNTQVWSSPFFSLDRADCLGLNTYEPSLHYIQEQFEQVDQRPKVNGHQRELYTHITCATDSATMQFVFDAISDMIIQTNLIHAGIFWASEMFRCVYMHVHVRWRNHFVQSTSESIVEERLFSLFFHNINHFFVK